MNQQLLKRLKTIINKDPNNKFCADCNSPIIVWVDIKIGCYLCTRCAGIHREMGVDYSRIKSISLDKIDESTIMFLDSKGNAKVNDEYDAYVHNKPTSNSNDEYLRTYIKSKYMYRSYFKKSVKNVPKNESDKNEPVKNEVKIVQIPKPEIIPTLSFDEILNDNSTLQINNLPINVDSIFDNNNFIQEPPKNEPFQKSYEQKAQEIMNAFYFNIPRYS